MQHEYFKDRISAYFDGELKNEEEVMIAEHLKDCPECQKLYQQLEQLTAMVERESGLADADYWERSAERIEARLKGGESDTQIIPVKRSSWKGLGWKLTAVAASLAVLTYIAFYEEEISEPIIRELPSVRMTTPPKLDADGAEAIQRDTTLRERKDIPTPAEKTLVQKKELPAAKPTPQVAEDAETHTGAAVESEKPVMGTKDVLDKKKSEPSQAAEAVSNEMDELSITAESSVMQQFAAEPELSTAQWRQTRDSLIALITPKSKSLPSMSPSAGLMKTEPRSKTAAAQSYPVADSLPDIQQLLLNANFHLAKQSLDSTERAEAKAYLEFYAAKENARFKAMADSLLNQLK